MLSLELCLKRKQIRSAVQFRSCLFSYASTGSWSSCDSLHTWSRAAGELCVHYFSAVQSHSSQPAVIIECRSMFFGSQPLPRALILKSDIISGCFSLGETSSKLNKSKFTRLMLKTWKKSVIVVRAAASADPTHRQGVKWWQEEQRGEKLAQDQVHLTDFLAGCFIRCDTPLCSKYVPVNQIILYLDEVFSRWAWLYQK